MLKRSERTALPAVVIWAIFFFCVSAATGAEKTALDQEQYGVWLNDLPSGWIYAIDEDSVNINDTSYLFDDATEFQSNRNELQEGVFVKFELSHDNYLAVILVADPREKDMHMKPIERADDGVIEDSSGNETESGELRMKNGVWVN